MNIINPRVRAALVFLLAVLVLWSRAPDRVAHGFLWAEDGREFIAYAHRLGKHSLLMDYAGYLHVLPRLLAYAQFMLTPIWAAPYVMVAACLVITAGTCAYIAATLRPPLLAIAMGIAPVLMPQTGEVFLSIANLQWIIFPLPFRSTEADLASRHRDRGALDDRAVFPDSLAFCIRISPATSFAS
jgi:hypothetical protein